MGNNNVDIDKHTNELAKLVGIENIKTDDLEEYNRDWVGSHKGK